MLEISAKSGKEKETEEEGYIRRERSYTRFYRAVHLPASVREKGSTGKWKTGVLTINASENETGRAIKENTN